MKKACKEFEALFWQEVLRSLRRSLPRGGFPEKSREREYYEEWLDAQYALLLAERGSSGLGEMLFRYFEGMSAGAPRTEHKVRKRPE